MNKIINPSLSRVLTSKLAEINKMAGECNQLAGEGNPFETKIYRKRVIENISIPDFEKQESLKWANWWMLRDVKRRSMNMLFWQYRINLKCLTKSESLPAVVRELAKDERLKTPPDSKIIRIRNRCAFTGRLRGKYLKYRMSRIVWREAADHGMVSGVIRAKWG